MERREALILAYEGERFRFYYEDDSSTLHIQVRHGTTTDDAIRTFIEGTTQVWDERHKRHTTYTETHGIYWVRHAHDDSVIIISCWRLNNAEVRHHED